MIVADEQVEELEEVSPEEAEERAAQVAEALRYGIPPEDYVGLTKREQRSLKMRRANSIKSEARRYGLDPQEYFDMSVEERAEARARAKRELSAPEPTEKVYTAADEVPATEHDPTRRDGMTIGSILLRHSEKKPDFAGKAEPRTLRDLYTYFNIGDGQHVIRVERLEPKVFQGVPCAGYLGEIRERISESQFQRYFGGRVYELQVYGPDPKGAHDEQTGLPKIKALTEVIKITVPLLPPNLHVLPAVRPDPDEAMNMQGFNPFAAPPATPSEAQMHRTNLDFVWKAIESANREKDEAIKRAENGGTQKTLIEILQKQHTDTVSALQRDYEAREKAAKERLDDERSERKKLEADLSELKKKLDEKKNGGASDAVELVKAVQPSRNASEEVARVSETFKEQIETLKENHRASVEALKERQDEEVKRLEARHREELGREKARYDDMEQFYKKTLEEERSKRAERERDLRAEIDRVRTDERSTADRRVQETEKRFEDRIKDLDKSHERELKSEAARWDTKLSTSEATLKMKISSLEERLAETKAELEQAREEAEKAGDPVEVMEKAEKTAKALGYRKPDEDKGPWETFAASAGHGVGQMLATFKDWFPPAMEKLQAGRQAAASQQQQKQLTPQQQQQIAAARQRRVAWATEGSVPATSQPAQNVPNTPLGFQTPGQQSEQQPTPQQPQPQQQAQPQPQQPAPEQQPPANMPSATNPLNQLFSDHAIEGFRAAVEQAINATMPAKLFAQQFSQSYPEPSKRLVELYKPENFLGYVKGVNAASPVLRRDGKNWLEEMWDGLREIHKL